MTVAGVSYQEFLAARAQLAPASGLDVTADEVHPALKPHQRDAVAWAVRGGHRALFESFGLGTSVQQLEIERLVLSRLGGGRGLIVCPLGVRQEFARDAHLIGVETTFIRSHGEASRDGIYVTNYESVRDGNLDPRKFDVVSLDEAAILRGFGGTKTFRELMGMYEGSAAFRFVATATPSPNEYIELLSYAAFLGILDVGQGKTRFFKRDSAHAGRLTLHLHMADEFWTWVASWALFLQRPSDLGRDDAGYDLPPLDIRWHEVESPLEPLFGGGQHKDGQGFMFRDAAFGVQEAAQEKRASLPARVAKAAEIVAESPGDHFLLWHDLEDERRAIEQAIPGTAVAADCEAAGIVLHRHPRRDPAEGLDRLRAAMEAGSHPRVYWRNAISRNDWKARCYPSLAESSAAVADVSLEPWNNTKVTTERCDGGEGCDLGEERP